MIKKKTPLTHARLLEALTYRRGTGVFVWRSTRRGQRPAIGDVAGSVNPNNGYVVIGIDGFAYSAHRLAWFYVYGEWPVCEIDHKDRNRENNRWRNLRPATNAQQRQNQSPGTNNKTGYLGVRLHVCGRFEANIGAGNTSRYLGLFDTAKQASRAYQKAKKQLHLFQPTL